jgi:hypothetical protein
LGLADTLKGSHDVQRERDEPIVIDIGQLALGLRPDELIRVELWRVPGKAVHVDAGMSLEKGPHVPTPMNLPAIPQQDEWSPQVAEQLAEERDDLGTGDVAHVEIEVQPEPVATRGHGERRDDGDLVTPITMPQVRSVSDGRPSLAHVWESGEGRFRRGMRDGRPGARRFFNRGHSLRFHRAMAASSRWRARRSGFCQLHCRPCRNSAQTPTGL